MSTPLIHNPPRLQSQVRLLLDHMEHRGLKAGDRLESERELAKLLGISRPSLREAIQILQVQGRLKVKHGIGIFVLDEEVGEKLRDSLKAAQHRIEELFQMREILEAPAVEWAAERRTESQLTDMKSAAKALNEAINSLPIDFDNVRRLDMQFHLTVARSAQNHFLNQTLGTLQEGEGSTRSINRLPPARNGGAHPERGLQPAEEKRDRCSQPLLEVPYWGHLHSW